MNDHDDLRRAIDDAVYAHGRALEPTAAVRRAVARRRTVQRFQVVAAAASVAAVTAGAVLLGGQLLDGGPTAGPATGDTTATQPTPEPSGSNVAPDPSATDTPAPADPSHLPPGPTDVPTVAWDSDEQRAAVLTDAPATFLAHIGSGGGRVGVVDAATGEVVRWVTRSETQGLPVLFADSGEGGIVYERIDDFTECSPRWRHHDVASGQSHEQSEILDGYTAFAFNGMDGMAAATEACDARDGQLVVRDTTMPEAEPRLLADGVNVRDIAMAPSGTTVAATDLAMRDGQFDRALVATLDGGSLIELETDGCRVGGVDWVDDETVIVSRACEEDAGWAGYVTWYDADTGVELANQALTSGEADLHVQSVSVAESGHVLAVLIDSDELTRIVAMTPERELAVLALRDAFAVDW